MYTIRTGNIRISAVYTADSPAAVSNPLDTKEFTDTQHLLKKIDQLNREESGFGGKLNRQEYYQELDRLHAELEKILQSMDKNNVDNNKKIIGLYSSLIDNPSTPEYTRTKLKDSLASYNASFEAKKVNKDSAQVDVSVAAANNIAILQKETTPAAQTNPDLEARKEKNTLSWQGDKMVSFLEAQLGVSNDLVKSLKGYQESGMGDRQKTVRYDLGDTNISSLLSYCVRGTVYIADGAYGPSEKSVVQFVKDYYEKNKSNSNVKDAFNTLLRSYDSYRTSYEVSLDRKATEGLKDKKTLITWLSDITGDGKIDSVNFSKEDTTRLTIIKESLLEKKLSSLSDEKLLTFVKTAIQLADKNVTFDVTSVDTLIDIFKRNPDMKSLFIQGVNSAAQGDNFQSLETGKLDYLGNEYEWIVKNKETVQSVLKSNTDKAIDAISKNPELSEDKRKAIESAREQYKKQLDNPEFLTQISRDAYIALTNGRIAGGLSSTHKLDMLLADTASIVVGVSTESGKIGAGIGVVFDKNLVKSEKGALNMHYGMFNLVPLVGVSGRYDVYKASLTGTPLGFNLGASMELGNFDKETNRLEALGSAEAIKKHLWDIAKNPAKGIESITIISDSSISSSEKSQYDATSKLLLEDLRNRVEMAGLSKDADPARRYLILTNALTNVINDQLTRIQLDASRGGWSLKEVGINLGMFSGIAYLLPGVRFGRTFIKDVHEKKGASEKVEIKSDTKNLIGNYELKDDTLTFDKPIAAEKVDISELTLAELNINDKGEVIGIGKLDPAKALKFTQDGEKIKVTYSGNRAIQNGSPESLSFDEKIDLASEVNKPETRRRLSVWANPNTPSEYYKKTSRDFANAYGVADLTSPEDIKKLADMLITIFGKLKQDKPLITLGKALSSEKIKAALNNNATNLRNQIDSIRYAMMTDVSQVGSLNTPHTLKKGEDARNAVGTHFSRMTQTQGFKNALENGGKGLNITDWNNVIPEKSEQIGYNEGIIHSNMVAVTYSWKTGKPDGVFTGFGRTRVASDKDKNEYIKDGSSKKEDIYNTIISKNKDAFKKVHDKIKGNDGKGIDLNEDQMKELITSGKVSMNGGKSISLEGTKFSFIAYGACTNPGVAIELGEKLTIYNGMAGGELVSYSTIEQSDVNVTRGVDVVFARDGGGILVGGEASVGNGRTDTPPGPGPGSDPNLGPGSDPNIGNPVRSPALPTGDQ